MTSRRGPAKPVKRNTRFKHQALSAKSSEAKQSGKRVGKKSSPGTFTAEKRARFLELYAGGGPVREHAKKVGVSSVTIFYTVRTDPKFAQAYETAKEANTDHVEDDIHNLACGGNLTAMFGILRARRPHVWRDNATIQHNLGDGFAGAFAAAMHGHKVIPSKPVAPEARH